MRNGSVTGDVTRPDSARRAVERLADPVVALDEDRRVTYRNDAASDRFDVRVGDALSETFPATAVDRLREHCEWASRRGEPVSVRVALEDDHAVRIHPDGDELTLAFQPVDPPSDASGASNDAPSDPTAEPAAGTPSTARMDGSTTRLSELSAGDLAASTDVAAEFELKERAINEAPVGITIASAESDDEPLVYINEAFEELTGYPAEEVLGRNCRFLQGEETDPEAVERMSAAIDAEEPVSVELRNYRRDGEAFWNKVDIAPVRGDDGEVTHFVGFQTDVTERKRAERTARRRAEELEFLLERIEGLLGDVTSAVVEADTRAEIEAAVCRRLADSDPYELAWVGERDVGRGTVQPRESATAATDATDAADAPTPDPDAEVVDTALRTGEFRVSADGHAAAIPLDAEDAEYGVLVVQATRPDAFDERERVVLRSLGRAIASAINARETRRILVADSVVETELSFRDPDLFFVAVSRETGAELTYRGSVHREDGSLVSLFSVSGADGERVVEAAEDCEDVAGATLVAEQDGASLVEFDLPADAVVSTVSGHGGKTQSISAADGEGRMVVEFPESADVRSLVDDLRSRYDGTELLALRHRERPAKTKQEFIASLSDELTDRQLTALQKAYVGGFFEWPRPVTGEDLASSMGISRSTFHEHLRAAQRKLCAEFFDGR